ncbi:MAG: glycosyltransferase family 39 protein, partial [Armatimonadota bacterium]
MMSLAGMPTDHSAAARPTARRLAWCWLGLAGAIALASVIRIAGLTAKSLWFDETVSVLLASQPFGRMLALIAANDPHPPLYYILLHTWMAVFGDGEGAVRALSVVIAVPVVMLTWAFGRRLIGPKPALIAALLVALAPAQVAASQEARMYGLLSLGALGSWWALWTARAGYAAEAAGAPRLAAWAAYVVATAAMMYGHYYALFVVAAQVAYLAWSRAPAQAWRAWGRAGMVVLILLLPWAPALAQQLAGGMAWPAHRDPLTPLTLVNTFAAMVVGQPAFDPTVIRGAGLARVALAVAALAAAAVAVVAALRRASDASRLLTCAAAGPPLGAFMLSVVLNVYAPRYLSLIVPPAALLVGLGAVTLASGRRVWQTAAGLTAVVLLVASNATATLAFRRQPRLDAFDWRYVSATLAAQARPDDAIAFLPGFSRIPVNYNYRGWQRRLALTPAGADVIGDGGRRMNAVVSVMKEHPRVWILTVPPIPAAVETLVGALKANSFEVTRQEAINLARLILLERVPS